MDSFLKSQCFFLHVIWMSTLLIVCLPHTHTHTQIKCCGWNDTMGNWNNSPYFEMYNKYPTSCECQKGEPNCINEAATSQYIWNAVRELHCHTTYHSVPLTVKVGWLLHIDSCAIPQASKELPQQSQQRSTALYWTTMNAWIMYHDNHFPTDLQRLYSPLAQE